MSAPAAVSPSARAEPISPRGWNATVVGLHVFCAVILTVSLVTALFARGDHDDVAAVAVAVLAVGYAAVGGRGLVSRRLGPRVAYLLLLVAVLGAVSWSDPSILFLLTLAYPQVWFLVEDTRTGLVWTGVLGAASTGGLVLGVLQQGGSPLAAVADSSIGLVFSIAMGLWVGRVLEQSQERALLIATLEATRAELAAAHHEQGVTAERERWAREVHDTVAQGYTSVVVLAQTAEAELETDVDRVRDRLRLIADVSRENLGELRAIVAASTPVALHGSSLTEALCRLGDRFAHETGLPVEVAVADAPAGLSRDEEVVLLRTAQEALTNTRRHANASRVQLSLALEGSDVVVRVTDDGAGFDTGAVGGFGLAGLTDRIRQAGGALEVRSSRGHGTVLAARLPAQP